MPTQILDFTYLSPRAEVHPQNQFFSQSTIFLWIDSFDPCSFFLEQFCSFSLRILNLLGEAGSMNKLFILPHILSLKFKTRWECLFVFVLRTHCDRMSFVFSYIFFVSKFIELLFLLKFKDLFREKILGKGSRSIGLLSPSPRGKELSRENSIFLS